MKKNKKRRKGRSEGWTEGEGRVESSFFSAMPEPTGGATKGHLVPMTRVSLALLNPSAASKRRHFTIHS